MDFDVIELIKREEVAGELKLTKVAFWICFAGFLFGIMVLSKFNKNLGLVLCIIAFGYAAYYMVIIWIIKIGHYKPWIKYLSSTLEVSAATIVAIVDACYQSLEYALTSSPPYIYFIAVAATTLRFRIKLSLYAGTLAAIESLLFYMAVEKNLSKELITALPSLSITIYFQRAIYIFLSGLMAAAITGTAHRLSQSFAKEMTQRKLLRRMFGKYVSPVVAEKILDHTLSIEGETREVTILCSDIRGFTKFSSNKDPKDVVHLLNALFDREFEIVSKFGGHVNKFIGDGMLAIFGAPLPEPEHALKAALAALEIIQIPKQSLPCIPENTRLGVSLHTGNVVIGNVGASEKLEYTVIGDTVNTAFRIEGLNARLGTSILITESTKNKLKKEASLTTFPPQRIRGKEELITVYELKELL
ncbi:MAG: adenylate/guanylate cyclase domain-containing protein [Desulfobacterales bacterium]|nr:adenylate/guanylate cyclase domain-containing protein [Desulfobacterales bacterium]